MAFHLRTYTAPDFSKEKFISAPDVVLKEAPSRYGSSGEFSCTEHISGIF